MNEKSAKAVHNFFHEQKKDAAPEKM